MILKILKYDNLNTHEKSVDREGKGYMEIGKISLHKTTSAQKVNNTNNTAKNNVTSNPFGVSFKGNVIQADVFESSKKSSSNGIAEKSKLFASAVVSGINNFNESFKSRMNSVVSFGKKVTKNVFDSIEKIGNTEISFNMEGIKNKLFPDRQYSVKNLSEKSVDEIKTIWTGITPEKA